MTNRPYTHNDLIAEAARQHAALTEDPDFMSVGEMMEDSMIESTAVDLEPETGIPAEMGVSWGQRLNGDDYNAAQRRIHDLIHKAANVSEWAVKLGIAELQPHEPFAIRSMGEYDIAVQVATHPDLTDTARTELLAAIRAAVEETTCRVLGMKPANPNA